MESALKGAVLVPVEIMRLCGEALEILRVLADQCSRLAVSDAACGAILAKSAMQAGWMNVLINTAGMKDRVYAEQIDAAARSLLEKYLPFADEIFADIERILMKDRSLE
jgi:formiminotetrahydrofolate cyclodeaminase